MLYPRKTDCGGRIHPCHCTHNLYEVANDDCFDSHVRSLASIYACKDTCVWTVLLATLLTSAFQPCASRYGISVSG